MLSHKLLKMVCDFDKAQFYANGIELYYKKIIVFETYRLQCLRHCLYSFHRRQAIFSLSNSRNYLPRTNIVLISTIYMGLARELPLENFDGWYCIKRNGVKLSSKLARLNSILSF